MSFIERHQLPPALSSCSRAVHTVGSQCLEFFNSGLFITLIFLFFAQAERSILKINSLTYYATRFFSRTKELYWLNY